MKGNKVLRTLINPTALRTATFPHRRLRYSKGSNPFAARRLFLVHAVFIFGVSSPLYGPVAARRIQIVSDPSVAREESDTSGC